MKKLFYMLIFGLCFHFSLADASAFEKGISLCKKHVQPELTISFSPGKLKYYHSKSSRTLTRLHRQKYGKNVLPGNTINGLSTYQLNIGIDLRVAKKQVADKVFCFYPDQIHIKIAFQDPAIYIASQLQQGTCEYEVTRRHEQTHHRINRELFADYLPTLQEKLIEMVKRYGVASRDHDVDIAIVNASLQTRYNQELPKMLEEIQQKMNDAQSYLDNAQQYRYEEGLCRK